MPKAVVLTLALIAFWLILRRTAFGTAILSLGSSEASAHLNGVPVDVTRYDGLIHGFFDMGGLSPAAKSAIEESCGKFRKLLHG